MVQAIYCIKPLARLVRRGLNAAAPQGLSQATIAAGRLAGATLLLDMQIEKDYWLGAYEPELQDAIGRHIRPGMVVYDVGANVGYISLMLARAVGESGRVLAFEPLPANAERIRRNAALNPEGSAGWNCTSWRSATARARCTSGCIPPTPWGVWRRWKAAPKATPIQLR